MKYRRIPSKKRYASRGNRQVRRIDSERRLRAYWYKGESIDFSAVFEQNRLEKGKKTGFFEKLHAHMARATAVRKIFFGHVRRLSRRVLEAASAFLFWTKEKIRKNATTTAMAMLSGRCLPSHWCATRMARRSILSLRLKTLTS